MNKGEMINRRATLGSLIVSYLDQIPDLEKQSRRTPPKTLKNEWEKVEAAKVRLSQIKEELPKLEEEYSNLRKELGETPLTVYYPFR